MGIEQNQQGAYLPDKDTQWPKMTPEERSKVYGSLKETYGGHLSQLDAKTELAKKNLEAKVKADLGMEVDQFWRRLDETDFRNEFKANDPKLKGMPVSMALLLTFQDEGRMAQDDAKVTGIRGKERELMFFCLNYLQNAPENKSKNSNGKIDLVPKDGSVKILQADEAHDDRWMLQILDGKQKVLFEGYLFPSDFSPSTIFE
jgi:hypothetical protein